MSPATSRFDCDAVAEDLQMIPRNDDLLLWLRYRALHAGKSRRSKAAFRRRSSPKFHALSPLSRVFAAIVAAGRAMAGAARRLRGENRRGPDNQRI
jgi:hypothetical protein